MMWEYQVTAEMYEQMKDIDIRSVWTRRSRPPSVSGRLPGR